jgi:2',3'-cyclic-nucleotide 2'-phosphodiesterase (5'-nucleotidase family)
MSVIHTNDLHGRVDQYPQMITAVNDARLTRPHNLLLDAGDIFSGTLYFNEFKGQAALHFMNMMDYDAFSFGNHEFDLADASADVVHKDLVAFIDNADFPFVASNLDFSQHQEFDTYTTDKTDLTTNPEDSMIYDGMIKEMNGEKVGIFGLSTEDIANISSPVDVTFSDAFTRAEEMVAQFEAAGVDRIVALTHLGYNSDPSVGNDLTLAEAVEGIDIIVGGHSHDFLAEPTIVMNESTNEPTVIVQAGQYGEAVGTLDVIFNDDGVITAVKGALVDVNEQVPNKLAEEALTPFTEAVEELALEPAGFSLMEQLANPRLSSGDDSSVRANETALGNMIADGFLRAGKKADANTLIAFQNGGGVRAPLPESLEGDGPYEITVGDLITVQPFGNRLTLVDLTGEEILTALETSVKDAPEEKRPLKK